MPADGASFLLSFFSPNKQAEAPQEENWVSEVVAEVSQPSFGMSGPFLLVSQLTFSVSGPFLQL